MSLLLPPLAEAAEEPLRKSLSELASDLAMGRLSSRELVSLCLGQVEKLDHQIKAWVMIDQAGALAAADESDERRSKGRPRSELDGIPFGVKDTLTWPAGRLWPVLSLGRTRLPELMQQSLPRCGRLA